jgi:hypothetical protein
MAGHESPRTTKLYDRTKDEITLREVGQAAVVMPRYIRFSRLARLKNIFSGLIAFSDLYRSLIGSVGDHRFDLLRICVLAKLDDPKVVFIGF